MTTPEGRIKGMLDRRLKKLGRSIWMFSPQAGPHGTAGVPDRLVCVAGRLVGIECKSDPSKKPTRLQERCMKLIEGAGGKCFVVCDKETMEIALAYVEEILNESADQPEGAAAQGEESREDSRSYTQREDADQTG